MPDRSIPNQTPTRLSLRPHTEALRIVLPYVILGCLWIFLSDSLMNLATDTQGMLLISNIKGWLFVAITAALLWALVYGRVKRLKSSEAKLRDSEARFKLLVEYAPDAVFVQTDHRLTYVNAKAVELFGADSESELIGKDVADFADEETRRNLVQKIVRVNGKAPTLPVSEIGVVRPDGARVDAEISTVPIRYNNQNSTLVFMRDITERKQYERNRLRMELQLRQKHRLESVGTLAGGIAHEINNPITGIINYAQLIEDDPQASETMREYSRDIMREGQRVADIVKNLLNFSHQEKRTFTPAVIRGIINETVSLIRSVLQHDQIDLRLNIAEGLPKVSCCAQQIKQALMNLITNAREALNVRYPAYDENKALTISASAFDREGAAWVRMVVEDNGVGISEDYLPRIFDPFYTSGIRSEHAGLGLFISHRIVKEHHGEIYFDTQPGQYTRAVIELPVKEGALV